MSSFTVTADLQILTQTARCLMKLALSSHKKHCHTKPLSSIIALPSFFSSFSQSIVSCMINGRNVMGAFYFFFPKREMFQFSVLLSQDSQTLGFKTYLFHVNWHQCQNTVPFVIEVSESQLYTYCVKQTQTFENQKYLKGNLVPPTEILNLANMFSDPLLPLKKIVFCMIVDMIFLFMHQKFRVEFLKVLERR